MVWLTDLKTSFEEATFSIWLEINLDRQRYGDQNACRMLIGLSIILMIVAAKTATRAVFGDYIHVYDMQQAREDGATVAIYYESRLAKLRLNRLTWG